MKIFSKKNQYELSFRIGREEALLRKALLIEVKAQKIAENCVSQETQKEFQIPVLDPIDEPILNPEIRNENGEDFQNLTNEKSKENYEKEIRLLKDSIVKLTIETQTSNEKSKAEFLIT